MEPHETLRWDTATATVAMLWLIRISDTSTRFFSDQSEFVKCHVILTRREIPCTSPLRSPAPRSLREAHPGNQQIQAEWNVYKIMTMILGIFFSFLGPCSGSLPHTSAGIWVWVTLMICTPSGDNARTLPLSAGAGRWWNIFGSPLIKTKIVVLDLIFKWSHELPF